uniref:Uncharacterized protein n=1 Tax=Vespula pensylvanica TaxID=30213 RepID=A0A834UAG6_VESPE|nr:hypothetical protein H0235_006555 [Vespula pensylvanica]
MTRSRGPSGRSQQWPSASESGTLLPGEPWLVARSAMDLRRQKDSFNVLESRREVYNLARKVWGHAATRQSAYVYARTPREGQSLVFVEGKGEKEATRLQRDLLPGVTRAVVEPFSRYSRPFYPFMPFYPSGRFRPTVVDRRCE